MFKNLKADIEIIMQKAREEAYSTQYKLRFFLAMIRNETPTEERVVKALGEFMQLQNAVQKKLEDEDNQFARYTLEEVNELKASGRRLIQIFSNVEKTLINPILAEKAVGLRPSYGTT